MDLNSSVVIAKGDVLSPPAKLGGGEILMIFFKRFDVMILAVRMIGRCIELSRRLDLEIICGEFVYHQFFLIMHVVLILVKARVQDPLLVCLGWNVTTT